MNLKLVILINTKLDVTLLNLQQKVKFKMEFIRASKNIGQCTINLSRIYNKKEEYTKKINYQMSKLLVMIRLKFSQQRNLQNSKFGIAKDVEIDQILSEAEISLLKRLFTNKQSLLNYQDICQYLHVNYSLGNKYIQYQIQNQDLQAFLQIVKDQQKTIQNFIRLFKEDSINVQKLFDQIDFFNNGFINTSSLIQFLIHYLNQHQQAGPKLNSVQPPRKQKNNQKQVKIAQNQILFDEKGCQILLTYIRGSFKSEKVFLKDFYQFFTVSPVEEDKTKRSSICNNNKKIEMMQQHKINQLCGQNLQNQDNLSIQDKFKNKARHNNPSIKQNSLVIPIKIIQNFDLIHQSGLDIKEHNQNINLNQINLKGMDQNGESQLFVSFEDKMIQTFKRNQAYIKQIKRKQQFCHQTYKFNSVRSYQNKNKISEWSKQKQQFILSMKVLANEFNSKKEVITLLIKQSPKFTLLNGFNIIDYSQASAVSLQQFKSFLKDCQIQKQQNKIKIFFELYSRPNSQYKKIMDFSCFSKIFRLKSLFNQIKQLKQRRPIIYESWTKKMKNQYCSFIRNIIDVENNIFKAKKHLLSIYQKIKDKKYQIEDIFQNQIVKNVDIKKFLGINSQALIEQITYQNFFQLKHFQSFLIN